jgi:hypothetical protein
MELLIIKSGNDYIRVKAENYILCQVDKASVFPLDKLEAVKDHAKIMSERGFARVSISKLMLSEEPFNSQEIED